MQGKIIRGIAGFYYVFTEESGIYECRARGIFRKDHKKPLVGDNVIIEVLDEKAKEGNLTDILPRKNELIRPAAANVDQALIIFAVREPDPSFSLLDRFLISMEHSGIPSVICFNKTDLGKEKELMLLRKTYEEAGYPTFMTSTRSKAGVSALNKALTGKTTVAAGPSGVGKSSITNLMQPYVKMETGEISKKLARGKNTTRRCELIPIENHGFIMDTPGFSALNLTGMDRNDLRGLFPEFHPYEGRCYYQSCAHISEPDCAVKDALAKGLISRIRYDDYVSIYEELKEQEKRRYS